MVLGWAMCGHGRVDPVQLNCAQCVASGRKNALLSHQDVNYREPLLSSTGRTSKPQYGDGRRGSAGEPDSNHKLKTAKIEEWVKDADGV